MQCEIGLHEGLLDLSQDFCPFCQKPLKEENKNIVNYYLCCKYQDIIIHNESIVCKTCGVVQGYKKAKEFINFYENLYRIKRKSVYHRKYHLNNILMKQSINFSMENKRKILRIFFEIDKILPQINGERKRMISLNFILIQVLRMMDLPFNKIQISKSKRTLNSYQEYWEK